MKAVALKKTGERMVPVRTPHSSPSVAELLRRMGPLRAPPVPTVDAVMVEERAASFTKRSIKTTAKLAGLKMAVAMCDLSTLEGKDTPGKVAYLCRKALRPANPKYDVPPCAAVCIYPSMVKYARKFLGDQSPVKIASSRPPASPADNFPSAPGWRKRAAPWPTGRMRLTW